MLQKAKNLTNKLPHLMRPNHLNLTAQEVQPARDYIAAYWDKLTRYNPKDKDSLVGLPRAYLVPSFEAGHEFDYDEMYYWDSYFMSQCMMDKTHKDLVIGMIENLIFMYKKFGVIPNGSRTFYLAHSHPPFLSSLIMEAYSVFNLDKKWLASSIKVAEDEYNDVWMGVRKPHARQVYEGLSRYYDFNYLHDLAEAESGWDMTPRFGRKALNYLPVDLNSLLYKYEKDFAAAAKILGNKQHADNWDRAAHRRLMAMNSLMWSELRGLYYDYNYVKKSRGSVASLAAYYPMWAGLANNRQAARLVNSLKKFEKKGGLATTDAPQVSSLVPGALPTQWAYPNGWAPLHFIVVKALQKYGYQDEARRIALKWLRTNLVWFNKHGVFLEKYNVVQPNKPPAKGVYPSQTGFGWTNAVFERFCQDFIDKS
ncbi:MAG TPA: trehalase family glycosidase [Candidatus Saccharimonadales bacterium]|nr:trehalase family glycosidase [Candidatus Saccharimonadales bacterium]